MILRIFSPATVANVACGFDILGFALQSPGDEILIRRLTDTSEIRIINQTDLPKIPTDPTQNTLGVSLQKMLTHLGDTSGFEITMTQKIRPGSGIGSSSASAAASVFGANELLGKPFSRKELVAFAMEGERAACGAVHADNVAPALLGGFALVRSYTPLDVVELAFPEELYCTVVHPQIELKTEDSRRVLRRDIPLQTAIVQWGNIAGLVAGLFKKDYELIGRSLEDVVIEPIRSTLIPGYALVKRAAMSAGALGCSISGSGPALFALSSRLEIAQKVSEVMQAEFSRMFIESRAYVSQVNREGVQVMES